MQLFSGKRYRDFSTFLKGHFQGRVQKLSIDAGFSCPNRDGFISNGGCSFCNNDSFNPDYCRESKNIKEQIDKGILFFNKNYPEQSYLAYFQAYSNTYASLSVLKERYREALDHPNISGLVIATRPDVVTEEVLDYLSELNKKYYICVEYGVESTNDRVLESVNRGHDFACSKRAIRATADRGITVGVHLIFGLPGESREEMVEGALQVCELPVNLLKFHQLQIIKDTDMENEYRDNPTKFSLFTQEEYLDLLVEVIERMPSNIYLERFVNQAPSRYVVAPRWSIKNFEFTAKLEQRLEDSDSWQGKYYNRREDK